MKKIAILTVIIIFLLVLGFLSPWNNVNFSFSKLLGLGEIENYSGLKVYSLIGEVEIYVDNEYKDTITPDGGPFEDLQVDPGLHQVRLKRKSEPDNSYFEFVRTVKFEGGVDVIISYELGPTEEFSEGHIFYAEEKFDDSSTSLNVISIPDGASLYIDDVFIGETPISSVDIDISNKHEIRVEKKNYESINFSILPETQEERDKLKGYNLNLEINMFLPPITIIDKSQE